ncbi:MAG: hypothetical protein AAF485_15990 [Chloroflexota bacterium]
MVVDIKRGILLVEVEREIAKRRRLIRAWEASYQKCTIPQLKQLVAHLKREQDEEAVRFLILGVNRRYQQQKTNHKKSTVVK